LRCYKKHDKKTTEGKEGEQLANMSGQWHLQAVGVV